MIAKLKNIFFKSEYIRNIAILATGSTLATAIPVLISPILTRLYTPDDFGVLSLFISVCAIVGVMAGAKYELAIVLPRKENDAENIVVLTILLSLVFVLIAFFVSLLFGTQVSVLLNNDSMTNWLYIVPFFVLVQGLQVAISSWAVRKKSYRSLSLSNIIQSVIKAAIGLLLGWLCFGDSGLIIALIASQLIAIGMLVFYLKKNRAFISKNISLKKLKTQAIKYINFPKFMILGSFANTSTVYLINILISLFYGTETVGYIALADRVVALPVTLISRSVGEVYKQKASENYAKEGNCYNVFIKTFKFLFAISFIPFLVFFISAPFLFTSIFGENWKQAGVYARIFSVMLLFRIVANPLSYTILIAEKQRLNLVWQLFLLLFTTLGIYLGYYFFEDAFYSVMFFSAVYSFMYLINLFISFRLAKGKLQ